MTASYKRITESIEDLLGKSHYLVAKSQMDGNLTFDGHTKTTEELNNESRCRSLCTRIESVLATCREEEILELLEMYDLLHRIGYGKAPSPDFLVTQRNRVYTAWKSGNSNIQESQIYRLLKKSTNGRSAANNMLRKWLKTLLQHNCFANVTTHENYQRLSIIMREKIAYLLGNNFIISGQLYGVGNVVSGEHIVPCGKTAKELKREWYEANKVDDFSTLNLSLLKTYRNFIASLFPSVLTHEEQQEVDKTIVSKFFSRHNLDSYGSKTIALNGCFVLD